MIKNPLAMEMQVQFLDREDPLEKEMATHSSILAWRIPWIEEPCGLQFMGRKSRTRLSNFTSPPYVVSNHTAQPLICHFPCHFGGKLSQSLELQFILFNPLPTCLHQILALSLLSPQPRIWGDVISIYKFPGP